MVYYIKKCNKTIYTHTHINRDIVNKCIIHTMACYAICRIGLYMRDGAYAESLQRGVMSSLIRTSIRIKDDIDHLITDAHYNTTPALLTN